jgi:hypothetical protein
MKLFRFLLPLFLSMPAAWAQTAAAGDGVAQTGMEQRRSELRSALKTPRGRDAPDPQAMLANSPQPRQLSAQERADLRQQLRQQRRSDKVERP